MALAVKVARVSGAMRIEHNFLSCRDIPILPEKVRIKKEREKKEKKLKKNK